MPKKKKLARQTRPIEEKKERITNPYGANQYTLDPRQNLCWNYYVNPKSETFGNAYQSAMKAGYEEGTSAMITTVPWFLEKLRRLNLLSKAEKVLEETLDMECTNPIVHKLTGEIFIKKDSSLLKIKQDSAKFVASTQGKNEGYSTRQEVTGENGTELMTGLTPEQKEKLDKLLFNDK